MNGEGYTILNVRSFVGTFSDLRLMKHWKSVSLTDSDVQTFLEGEEKYKSENAYSVALVMTFLAAESENRQLKDLPQADLGRAPERFLLSVRTNSITDNFVYWKWGSLFVFVVIWNTCLILKFIEIFKFWALRYLFINFWIGVSYTWITNLRVSAFLNSWSLCNA